MHLKTEGLILRQTDWKETDNADTRLWLTVGVPGFPYMFKELPAFVLQ